MILLARSKALLSQLADEITKAGGTASYYVCDITDHRAVKLLAKDLAKKGVGVDVLVNNAGIWVDADIQQTDPDRIIKTLETNIAGHIYVTESLLPLMPQDRVSRILNVVSTAGVEGIPAGNNTAWKTYGASKWGFRGYTNALRESLRGKPIQVMQFFPGGFESDLYENAHRKNAHHQPWMMKTEDVADIIIFALTRPDDVYMEQIVVSKYMS